MLRSNTSERDLPETWKAGRGRAGFGAAGPPEIYADLGLRDTDHRDDLAVRACLAHTLDSSASGEPSHGP